MTTEQLIVKINPSQDPVWILPIPDPRTLLLRTLFEEQHAIQEIDARRQMNDAMTTEQLIVKINESDKILPEHKTRITAYIKQAHWRTLRWWFQLTEASHDLSEVISSKEAWTMMPPDFRDKGLDEWC